jgi:hypothetical protein
VAVEHGHELPSKVHLGGTRKGGFGSLDGVEDPARKGMYIYICL